MGRDEILKFLAAIDAELVKTHTIVTFQPEQT